LQAVYVSGQYGVILPANVLKEKEEMKLKVYNKYIYPTPTYPVHISVQCIERD
jgi:hypothetical protein